MNLAIGCILSLRGGAKRQTQSSKSLLWLAMACVAVLCCRSALGATGSVQYAGIPSVISTAPVTLNGPQDAQADGNGNLYIADMSGNKIVKVASNGTASVVPMTGLSPALNTPAAIAFDGAGNMYIADQNNNVVRMVTPGGVISTVAGTAPPDIASL